MDGFQVRNLLLGHHFQVPGAIWVFGGVSINIRHLNKPISSMLGYKKGGGRIPPISSTILISMEPESSFKPTWRVISPAIPLPTCQVVMSPKGWRCPELLLSRGITGSRKKLPSFPTTNFQPKCFKISCSNQNKLPTWFQFRYKICFLHIDLGKLLWFLNLN